MTTKNAITEFLRSLVIAQTGVGIPASSETGQANACPAGATIDDDKKYKFLSLLYGKKRRQMKKLTSAPTMTTRVPTPDHSFACDQ